MIFPSGRSRHEFCRLLPSSSRRFSGRASAGLLELCEWATSTGHGRVLRSMPRPRGSPSSPAPGPNPNDLGHRIFGELVGDAYRLLRRQSGGVHRCESCRSGKPVPAFGLAKYWRTTQIRRRELRTSLLCGTLIVWAPHPRRVVGARLCSVIATPVLRHSAALLEGRSGAAALLGSSCARYRE